MMERTEERTETHACDCISRQAAIDELIELYEYQRDIDPTEAADLVRQGVFLAEKRIEKLPSAQPERKTGRWLHGGKEHKAGTDWMHCSECGYKTVWSGACMTPYCPWCGAWMGGEHDGSD